MSVTRRADLTPLASAYVKIDEGITILTNIIDCGLAALKIGRSVEVIFQSAEDCAMVPIFKPALLQQGGNA